MAVSARPGAVAGGRRLRRGGGWSCRGRLGHRNLALQCGP
jgi:hypothetical protein